MSKLLWCVALIGPVTGLATNVLGHGECSRWVLAVYQGATILWTCVAGVLFGMVSRD